MFREGNWIFLEDEVGDSKILAPCIPKVVIEPLRPDIKLPWYAFDGDSGMDVYAPEDVLIESGKSKAVKLGFKLGISKHPLHDFGYRWECQVRPRSGISAKTMMQVILGSIDNPYRGEVGVIIHNTNFTTKSFGYPLDLEGNRLEEERPTTPNAYLIRKGERFAQLVFNEVIRPIKLEIGIVDETDRGSGGFGSTGVS